jgi:predicted ATPase/signal transduction histidine kinase
MFLDDLQWADSASLNLIQLLMNESESHYLLMIGAYRDNEVSPAHPLMLTLDAVAKANAIINTITLGSLTQESLNQLVADTLNCHILTAQALTELIAVKTKGNPFFATQFLKALYQDGLVQFDGNLGYWQCDLAEIRTVAMSDDVVEFMSLQLQKLPNYTQDILKLAACIGAQFDLKTLAIVSQQSESDAAVALWKALQSGLVIPQSEIYKFYVGELDTTQNTQTETLNYKFLHDRVQQAASSLIPENQKEAIHLKIGQLLLQDTSPTTREEKLFDIVNHLNVGKSLITEPSQLTELAQLNLDAGRKAKLSTAYGAAIAYCTIGIELLEPDCWQSQYELTLNLYVVATEVAYLNGDFEGMQYLAAKVLQRAQTILDKVKIYDLKIQYLTAQNQLHNSLKLGLQILDELNVQIASLESVKKGVKLPTLSDIDRIAEMRNPYKIAAMQMLISVLPAVFLTTNRFAEFVLTLINLSLEFGRSELACYAYAAYGWLKCGQGEIKDGYHAGKIALKLIEIYDSRKFKCKVNLLFAAHIQHWKEHLNNTPLSLLEALKDGLNNGDNEYAGYAAMHLCHHHVWAGEYLPEVYQKQEKYIQIAGKEIAQEFCREFGSIWKQLTENLLCLGKYQVHLIGESFNENERLSQLIQDNSHNPLVAVYVSKLILHYLYSEYSQALENGNLAYPHTLAIPGVFSVFIHNLFWSLSLLKCCENVDINTRKNYDQQIDQNQQNLRLWANQAPMNFLHKFHLVEAERHRVLGSKAEAIDLYDRAIAGAKANEYIQEEALANELAAKFYLDWGKQKVAASYMQEAYYCYSRWGAKAKTDDLETRYPELLCPILQHPDPSVTMLDTLSTIATPAYSLHSNTGKTSSSSSINTTLDFATILKASQALSRVIQLEDLLYQLTQIILQNSGGDRCALILPNENQVWEVRAIATPTETELYSEPLENNPNVPVKLIQYVKNTHEVVVIDDLETDLPVIEDYLRLRQPKSLLCLPILNQGNLVGILYLKNRLTSGVFTSDRIIILDFLCTQVAISLENARLYNQVQQTLTDLQQAQLKIVQSEKMSALGNLVAGVAHEINNPVGCIIGNVDAVQDSINDLFGLIDLYNDKFPQPGTEIEEELETIDLEYLRDDLPKLIRAMKDGGDRITSISKSLRTFSRADSDQKQIFNLHEGIDSTILILRHRLKASETRPAIEVVTNYGSIPAINCFPGQLNQVFMNLLANAIDAIEESNTGRSFTEIKTNPNRITIKTSLESEGVKITIADNGQGMSESVKQKIFDHLFTTKPVGKGTGLGLAIARQIVEETHNGKLSFNTVLGEGTEFIIEIPV